MRKGFTLVELSIVLVIIALIIGGVLVAKDMMCHARHHGLDENKCEQQQRKELQ